MPLSSTSSMTWTTVPAREATSGAPMGMEPAPTIDLASEREGVPKGL